jgi:glutamate-ammonia-ligase adenylyltransferase
MRERIQQNIIEKTLNLKYWPGGIRDLELFVHSLQLIHGGKKVSLKTVSTTFAIEEIQKLGIIPSKDAQLLLHAYWFYRTIENKVHAHGDQHTYELTLIPGLITDKDIEQFKQYALDVEKLLNDFLLPHKPKSSLVSDKDLKSLTEQMANDLGLAQNSLNELLTQDARSRTYERDENERRHFLKTSILLLQKQGESAGLALRHLTTFINNIRAKTSLYSLFNTHPQLIEEILWIFSTSPYLSQILIHRPDLVDSYIMKSADIDRSDDAAFFKSIYDLKLVAELTAASAFLRNRNLSALTENLSRTADVIAQSTLDYFLKKFPKIHIDILTMGKWAGLEMGLKSDLDFIFITDTEPGGDHMKLARRFVHSLQTPPSQPQIYSIDLRLRPSGSSGPLLSQLSEVQNYLVEKGMIWERQAYLRARLLSTSEDLRLFNSRPMTPEEKTELRSIQQKLLMPLGDIIDFKKTRGGLISTEFTIQLALLDQQKFPKGSHFPDMIEAVAGSSILAQDLLKNYTTLRTYHQLLILIADSPETSLQLGAPSFIKLASHLQTSQEDLFQQIVALLKNQDSLLKGLDPLA